jgi:hypothetical protein
VAANSISISPALPSGLSINPSTGVISGSTGSAMPATVFTVTAHNAVGATVTTSLTIVVN